MEGGTAAGPTTTGTPRFDPSRRRAVTSALLMVTALASFEGTVVSTAMPTIIGDLGGLPLYSWAFAVYLLAATVSMPIYGRLADGYGRRRILLTAIALFLAGAAACALARSMTVLIAARALQGLGAGGLLPTALTVSADLYPLRERAKVQSLFSAVWGVASLLGPLAGAALTLAFGWRSIFSINLPLGLVAFLLVLTQMRESRAPVPEPLDVAGAATLTAGVTALLLATLQEAGGDGLGPAARAGFLVLGVAALLTFIRQQARRNHPLVPPTLLRRRESVTPYLGGVLLGTLVQSIDTFVPLFVQGARGRTAMAAGAVVTPLVFLWAVSASLGGRAIVRFGFRRTARAGALLVALGALALLVAARTGAEVLWVSTACAVVGAGLGPTSMAQVLAIQAAAPEDQRGVATSLVPFFRALGGALGVGVLGAVLADGLSARLGPAAEAASRLLATPGGAAPPGVDAAGLRLAIEGALGPVFFALFVLAAANLWLAEQYPAQADPASDPGGR